MKNGLLNLVVIVSLAGCTFYRPMTVSVGPVGAKEEALSVVKGRSSAEYFLFFGPFGDDSLAAAVEDARKQAKADTITNVFVDRKIFWVPIFYMKRTTFVSGTAIRYLNDGFDHGKMLDEPDQSVAPQLNNDDGKYMTYVAQMQKMNERLTWMEKDPKPVMSFEEWMAKKDEQETKDLLMRGKH